VIGNGKNSFQKYFTLPCEIDPEKVTARFEDFILQIKCVVPTVQEEVEKAER
jgi:HSP20 family molecular chaperone IbpA